MIKSELLQQALRHFQIEPLMYKQMVAKIDERAKAIRPLLKQATLERLGALAAFSKDELFTPKIYDQDQQKMQRMLNFQTEGIFGAVYPCETFEDIPLQKPLVSKFWGLCRDSTWCFGKIDFIKKGHCEVDVMNIDFSNLSLESLISLWPDSLDIWNSLGSFVLKDMERAEKRYRLVQEMATVIEIENFLHENSL